MSVKLLTEHHLEFLSLTGGCTGSSESTLVKMPHIVGNPPFKLKNKIPGEDFFKNFELCPEEDSSSYCSAISSCIF